MQTFSPQVWLDAILNNDIKQVKTLLAQGVDVNTIDEDGSAALHIAIREGSQELVELLIEHGADVDIEDAFGDTPLDYAADNYCEKIFELLIMSGAAPYDSTLLHIASGRGQENIVQLAINHGADVHAKDAFGSTPLHYAAYNNHAKTVELLITSGAAVNAKDDDGATALHLAAENGYEVIKLLLAAGANINIQTNDGGTPLHWAAQRGDDDMVKLLLVNKADANIQDSYQRTALHYAVESGNTITVNVLLLHGADMQREDRDGMTPYMIAQEEDIREVRSELEFWYKYKNNVPTTLRRTFEYVDNTSNKFWNVEVTGSRMSVTFGKSGTTSVTKTKEFKDEAEARKAAEKLIKEKTNKGYREVLEF